MYESILAIVSNYYTIFNCILLLVIVALYKHQGRYNGTEFQIINNLKTNVDLILHVRRGTDIIYSGGPSILSFSWFYLRVL